MNATFLFNMAGIRTQYGLMHMSINDMKTVGLTDEQAERLRAWQQRQKDNRHGHVIPTKLPDMLSYDKYIEWMENEYLNHLAKEAVEKKKEGQNKRYYHNEKGLNFYYNGRDKIFNFKGP